MTHRVLRSAVFGFLSFAAAACTQAPVARYVYQDNEFGVIGIPLDTFRGRRDYHAEAEVLMARHFPKGYEIVRGEEVNEGKRVRNVGSVTYFALNPSLATMRNILTPVGIRRTSSFQQRDVLSAREHRIIYKRKSIDDDPNRASQFAASPATSPSLYVDPNRHMREQEEKVFAKSGARSRTHADSQVQTASE